MKVAFVTHHADFVGGGEHSLLDLLRHLPPEVEPVLATPAAGALAAQAGAAGVRMARLPMPPIGRRSFGAIRVWRQWLEREQPDLVHANSSRAAFYAGIACLGSGRPVIFHCRVAERDRRLDWLIGRLATRIVANSRATARRFQPRFAGKVETIYNGIELPAAAREAARPPEIGEGRIVLCVARMSRWKRHDLLLLAFEQLAAEISDLQLVLLGGGDPFDPGWLEELKKRSASMSCGNRIHWLGQRDDVGGWYAAAEALVLPSREEPFGRVVVEAMAYGLPVVAANAGGPAEIIESGVSGVLVDDDTPTGWADALRSVLAHGSFRDRLIDGGRRRAGEFSIERHVQAMQELFARLLRKR